MPPPSGMMANKSYGGNKGSAMPPPSVNKSYGGFGGGAMMAKPKK